VSVDPSRTQQRHHDHRTDVQLTAGQRPPLGLVLELRQPNRLPRCRHPTQQRALHRHAGATHLELADACRFPDPQHVPVPGRERVWNGVRRSHLVVENSDTLSVALESECVFRPRLSHVSAVTLLAVAVYCFDVGIPCCLPSGQFVAADLSL
jgi:hypothetical protein